MRILVYEPHPEVRALLAHVVERLGHEPVFPTGPRGEATREADLDVLLLEPAHPEALATAVRLLRRRGGLPVICASIYPDSGQAARLRPVAYLVKPFGLAELEAALQAAVDGLTPPAELAS